MTALTSLRYYKIKDKWKYLLSHPMQYAVPASWPRAEYYTLNNKLIANIIAGVLTILPGYAWDGMTCAPDWCLEASLIHDFGCQARTCDVFRQHVSQNDVDNLFKDVMKECGFILWPVYYSAVRVYQTVRSVFVKNEPYQLIEKLI